MEGIRTTVLILCLSLTLTVTDGVSAAPSHKGDKVNFLPTGGAENCSIVKCNKAPKNVGVCTEVKSKQKGLHQCCPNFSCVDKDGTKSKHRGLTAEAAETRQYDLPGGGKGKSYSSSSYSSSSSFSSGPVGRISELFSSVGRTALGGGTKRISSSILDDYMEDMNFFR